MPDINPDADFIQTMHIYMVSYAIHHAKTEDLKRRLREYYHHINDGCYGNDDLALNVLSSRLQVDVCMCNASAWEIWGQLAEFSGTELSEMVHDDLVIKCCFTAQLIWLCADSNYKKHIVANSISCGSPHPNLTSDAPELSEAVFHVIKGLKSCHHFTFNACVGIDRMYHIIHIKNETAFAELQQLGMSPFRCNEPQ